jgi:hypothetical protein
MGGNRCLVFVAIDREKEGGGDEQEKRGERR